MFEPSSKSARVAADACGWWASGRTSSGSASWRGRRGGRSYRVRWGSSSRPPDSARGCIGAFGGQRKQVSRARATRRRTDRRGNRGWGVACRNQPLNRGPEQLRAQTLDSFNESLGLGVTSFPLPWKVFDGGLDCGYSQRPRSGSQIRPSVQSLSLDVTTHSRSHCPAPQKLPLGQSTSAMQETLQAAGGGVFPQRDGWESPQPPRHSTATSATKERIQ